MQLEEEAWFHGSLSQSQAEALVPLAGQYLVRSSNKDAQFILTARSDQGKACHVNIEVQIKMNVELTLSISVFVLEAAIRTPPF